MNLESRSEREYRAATVLSSRALLKAQLRSGQHEITCPKLLAERWAQITPKREPVIRQLEPTRREPEMQTAVTRRVTIAEIQRRVCKQFGIPLIEMTSKRQHHSVAHPRQVAMYLARRFTPLSQPEIGRYFGGRDHTTVIYATHAVTKRRKENPDLDEQIAWVEAELITA